MPIFLVPISESNDCHNPAGPAGGQFCSEGGLTQANVADAMDEVRRSVGLGVTSLMANLAKYPHLPKSLHIQLIGVEEHERGKGLGAQAMERVERLAAQNDLIVTMSSANPKSKGFFVKRGYTPAPTERDPGFMYKDPRNDADARLARAKARVKARRQRLASMAASERERRRQSPGTTAGVAQQKRDERMARGRATQKLIRAIRARED
jgi:GNAT superfamily N-acetyltransferase